MKGLGAIDDLADVPWIEDLSDDDLGDDNGDLADGTMGWDEKDDQEERRCL